MSEIRALKKNGEEFDCEIDIRKISMPTGNTPMFTVFLRDITERKLSVEKLLLLNKELERSNKELQQFAYIASHDLQEPLRMVTSYMQLLSERYKGKLDSNADEFIAYAVDGATRMKSLIEALLAYSRVGTQEKDFTSIECEAILKLALNNLRMALKEEKAAVTHDSLPTIMADQHQIVQLFQNLIGNALKFHNIQSPRIHVSAVLKDKEWIFSVQDNGIGIAPEQSERIFTIFQRLHGREEYAGSGIGLSICRKIIERHKGRIWCESQLGKGTTFHFTLPAVRGKNDEQ